MAGCGEAPQAPEEFADDASALAGDAETELVFERVTVTTPEGEVSVSEYGALDRHQWRKAARPDPERDDFIYQHTARIEQLEDGSSRQTITFVRQPNDAPRVPITRSDEKVSPDARFEPDEEGRVAVGLKVPGFPAWDVPLELPPDFFSEEEEALGAAERAAGYARREALLEELRGPIDELVAELGGELIVSSWTSGWVGARVDPSVVDALVESPHVAYVFDLGLRGVSHEVTLGDGRLPTRYDSQQMISAGYDGDGVTIGVIEIGLLDDEACFLYDSDNGEACTGPSRLVSRSQCDNPSPYPGLCDAMSNLGDTNAGVDPVKHATVVASIAMADYTDGQGDGERLGDASWTFGPHAPGWEGHATSLAPEVELRFAGGLGASGSYSEAIDEMAGTDVRAINMSWSAGLTGRCSRIADNDIDEAVENAFDDAKLMIFAAGNDPNEDGDEFGSCDVEPQASLPKVLAVNALDPDDACEDDYQSCQVAVEAAANGGALTITPDGVQRSAALTLVSLTAMHRQDYITDMECDPVTSCSSCNAPTSKGLVKVAASLPPPPTILCVHGVGGSSFAAPVITSAAAVVYDWAAATFGSTTANSVGKLHTLMLGMGDSHDLDEGDTATAQRSKGADRRFGMGRLKVRKPDQAILAGTYLTDGSTNTVKLTIDPFASTRRLVKCVALSHEDMSDGKTRTSHVKMELTLRSPVSGSCSTAGSIWGTPIMDDSYDVKKMARYNSTGVGGKCAWVKLTGMDIEGTGLSGSLFCYASDEDDDEPN